MSNIRINNQFIFEFKGLGNFPAWIFTTVLKNQVCSNDTNSRILYYKEFNPNPADEICTAEVDASVEGERIIYVYDTYGHLLEVYPIAEVETSTELEVEELVQGVYLVLLYVDWGFRESKLLVVNHP